MPKRSLRSNKGTRSQGAPPSEGKRARNDLNLKWDHDENIYSEEEDSDGDQRKGKGVGMADDDEEEELSAEQKRKKLAHEYLSTLQGDEDEDEDDEENSSDEEERHQNISQRLQRERLEKQGKYVREVASTFQQLQLEDLERTTYSGHDLPVTCVALSSDDATIYSGSKDNSLLRFDVETGVKTYLRQKWRRSTHGDHQASEGEILAVAVSTDGKYVASGGRDGLVRIFDARTNSEIKTLSGHRDAVTCLTFRRDSPSLFSGSLDRCIKHWDMNEMGYLETLFGHQDGINGLDCWVKPRPLSCSSDRSLRLWNVHDETHLVFRGHKSAIDCAQYLTLDTYISSGEDGNICLWKESQKKPISTIHCAHGMNGTIPHWITSMTSLKISDLFATGSSNGYLNFWKGTGEKNGLELVNKWQIGPGFINGIALSSRFVVLGMGSEHRLGRWERVKSVRNRVELIKLPSEFVDEDQSNILDDSDNESEDSRSGSEEEEDESES